MSVEELFSQLRDIQAPIEPGWWPLAQGWWYVLFLMLLISLTLWFLNRRRQANLPVVMAVRELGIIKDHYLQNNNENELALKLSIWLKQVSLYAFPDQSVAGLTGQHWLEFLDKISGNNAFTQGQGQAFGRAVYDKNAKLNGQALLETCEKWLSSVKPELIKQGQA